MKIVQLAVIWTAGIIGSAFVPGGFQHAWGGETNKSYRYVCRFEGSKGRDFCTAAGIAQVGKTWAATKDRSDIHVVCAKGFDLIDRNAEVFLEGGTLFIEGREGDHRSTIEVAEFPGTAAFVAEAKLKNASLPVELEGSCEFKQLY